ncbi:hypothetical protein C8Q74DRAFT_1363701 [Fomes fomentarius]|nr:hypothetical protein C8Q74DRAFT_1363701 [Fomes fomentarius]
MSSSEHADPALSSVAHAPLLTTPSPAANARPLPPAPVIPPPASRHRAKPHIRQGEDVTVAFGFILDETNLMPWAEYFYGLGHDVKLSSLPPEEARKAYETIAFTAVNALPHRVYHRVRGLPRLRRAILLLNPEKLRWLFVLKDNSSRPALDLKLDPEDVKKVAEVLKVGEQEPKWYRVLYYR